jgi:transposase-like protein
MGEEHRQTPQRTRRGFTAEFKRDAVELVRSTGRPIAQIARELGIYDSTASMPQKAAGFPVAAACAAAGVSTWAFYGWVISNRQGHRQPTASRPR